VSPSAPADRADAAERLSSLRALRDRAGLFLDFDGTLSEIAPTPGAARPVAGAADVLSRLADRFAVVALVSGRPASDVRSLLDVPGVDVFGQYGLGTVTRPADGGAVAAARTEVEEAASSRPGAWVEDKGASVAVHVRGADRPDDAAGALRPVLERIAAAHGLVVFTGKMVLELAPADTPGKGAVVTREVRDRGLQACLYAGDDVADLAAFAALDELAAGGIVAMKVAVDGPETPQDLRTAADEVVDGPVGLVRLLEVVAS